MKKYLALIPLIFLASFCARANQSASGWCTTGAQYVITNGLQSSNLVQASYPQCTVTVTDAVTGLPVTIFRDNSNTILSNPFLATTIGQWQFYAANGRYTVTLSNLVSPTGAIAPPVSLPDIILFDCTVAGACSGGGGGGGNINSSPTPLILGLPSIATGAATIGSIPEYSDASVQLGADACASINANWTAITTNLSVYGGYNDARGFSGQAPCATNPLAGNTTLGGTLQLGATQYQAAVPWVIANGIIMYGNAAHSVTAPVGGVRGGAVQAISTFPINSPLLQIGTNTANTGSVSIRDLRVSMYPIIGPPSIAGGIGIQNLSGQEGTSLYNVIVDGGCGDGVLWATSQAQNAGPIMGLSVVDDGCSAPGPSVQLGQAGGSQLIANTSMFQFSGNGFNALTQQPICIALDFIANISLESGHCEEQGTGIEIGANHIAHNASIRNYQFLGNAAKPMTTGIDISDASFPLHSDNILLENIFTGGFLTNLLVDHFTANPCTIVAATENELGWYWRSQNSIFTSSKQCPDVWPAHNENFSASTFKIPTAPGCAASLTNELCFDSTLQNTHVLVAGVDYAIGSNSSFACSSGPNPWVDTCTYHMRAVTSDFTATTTTNATNAVTFTGGSFSLFQNNDGIMIPGAGASLLLATPIAPVVTPSQLSGIDTLNDTVVAPADSTTYSYCIVLRDANMGYTACSPTGTTTTGAATLGALPPVMMTSVSRSGQVVSGVASTAFDCSVGMKIYIYGSTDPTFSGNYNVTSCNGGSTPATTTTFTYTQGYSSTLPIPLPLSGFSTNSATGGAVRTYNVNQLTLPAIPSGGYQYLIYTAGGAFRGFSRPGETSWTDYGAAAPTLNPWFPSTAPSSASNDALFTTIVSGGGTATVSLATPAVQTVSGVTAYFDDGPTWQLACAAAALVGSVRISIPASGFRYFFNSPTSCTGPTIIPGGLIFVNELMTLHGINWEGSQGGQPCGSPQFDYNSSSCIIVGGAYPGVNFLGAPNPINYLSLSAGANGLAATLSFGGSFNNSFSNSSCTLPSTDVVGQCIVGYGQAEIQFNNVLFSAGTTVGGNNGYSFVPTLLLRNDLTNADGAGTFFLNHVYFVGRGMGWESNPAVGSDTHSTATDVYGQAVIGGPMLTMGPGNNPTLVFTGANNDTSSLSNIANWGASLTVIASLMAENSGEPISGLRPSIITGNSIPSLEVNYLGAQPWLTTAQPQIGQNINLIQFGPQCVGVNMQCTPVGSNALAVNGGAATTALNQLAANQHAGVSACVSSTKAIVLPITYNSQPVILVFDETTKGGANLSAKSASGFTVSCTGASDIFDWEVIGDPN